MKTKLLILSIALCTLSSCINSYGYGRSYQRRSHHGSYGHHYRGGSRGSYPRSTSLGGYRGGGSGGGFGGSFGGFNR